MSLEKKCTLWVHDEIFSKEPAIINMKIFDNIHPDDLLSVSSLGAETYSHEIPENSSTQESRKLNGMKTEHFLNLRTRYLFFARTIPGVAIPGLEISVSKHVADTFGLKHRSNVIVTTVYDRSRSENQLLT